ncbi:MAG: DUF167 domain-containing protein [Cyanobacteriota bacterium]
MSAKITKTLKGIKFSIRVVPKSSKNQLSLNEDGTIKLKINAPPVDGKANDACIKFLSNILEVNKSDISITSGLKSKTKILEVLGDSNVLYDKILTSLEKE